ncbi:hypothetical protein CR513_54071, partial [Mucuna pruriens]
MLIFVDQLNLSPTAKRGIYFLTEKSEAFSVFKNFKIHVEKEADSLIKGLHTNQGESLHQRNSPIFAVKMLHIHHNKTELQNRRTEPL